ncbi:LEA14-like dessication related protein [Hymenobacter luteus]|uniref:LEA14-like dessication related protein n=2 Tax=Hymenobacter TaxID=89966 RepID=A0A7W9WAL5_9BACT|nr:MULTISPECIES: LEA type 2 family protein [Hymenobacter]MBB4599617.1 LEA14-like dessication related protein [Hymenobacter latericoloratus]MBB6058073.1 LEA14-like dessication related protein [Hymenobacter luteus]
MAASFFRRHPGQTVALAFLLLFLIGGGWTYFSTDKGKELLPTLENTSLAVNNITASRLQAQMKTDLRNHMPVTLKVDSLSYQTRVDGKLLAEGSKDKPLVLKGNDVNHLQIPMAVDLSDAKKTLKNSQQDCVDVQMALTLYTRLPVAGAQKIPVELTKRVYIPKLPKIEVADVGIKDLGLKNGEAVVSLRVTNYNPFPVTVRRVSYNFSISDDMQVQGVEEKDVSFRKKGTELMPIRVRFEPKGLPKVAFKTLFKAKKTDYKLNGSAVVAAGQHNPKDMTMRFNSAGTLQDLKDIPKEGD